VEYRELGNTGIDVSVLMLGAWAFGHDAWEGERKIQDEESVRTIQAALDEGINWIDTAAGYGGGYSEKIVGQAVKDRRDDVVLASKSFGTPTAIHSTIDDCLSNMGIDCIDLYQIHYPDPKVPIADQVGAMKDIQEAGKIRFIGVSNFTAAQHREALETVRIETSQPPFNVFWREIDDDVLPFCRESNISVIPYSPLAQGLLAGRFRSKNDVPEDIRSKNKLMAPGILEECVEVVNRLEEIAEAHGKSIAQAAIAWTIQTPGITAPIIGCRKPDQLTENLGGVGWRLSDDEYLEISQAGKAVSDKLDYSTNMWGWAPS
jgi:aryl-alcohol dehydrogenase-like predicted oxidoreductase